MPRLRLQYKLPKVPHMPPLPRLGPRPLPLHLGTALMTWASSESAWRLWKSGSPSSNQSSPVADLLKEVGPADAGRFEAALHREIARRMDRLAEGVVAYRQHPFARALENPPAVWSEGNTRLLDYGATHAAARKRGARAVLVVPSLINRWEVLDLTAEKSLLRAMAAEGLRPYLVDWGTPDAEERAFDMAAYVSRLERALAFVGKRARKSPVVMGYCMGGTLAVALTALSPRKVSSLALLAAPWDFHADKAGHAFLLSMGPMLAQLADKAGELPVDVLQTLFWSLDPWLAMKKFERFLRMEQGSESAREFVLLEDWINGGAPLAGPVARECLVGWYGDNLPGTDRWTIAGKRIVPSKIAKPSLVMIPSGDRIVPPLSAAALAEPGRGLKSATRIDLPLGHIGMVVSGRARELCWTPLIEWLKGRERR